MLKVTIFICMTLFVNPLVSWMGLAAGGIGARQFSPTDPGARAMEVRLRLRQATRVDKMLRKPGAVKAFAG